MRRVRTPFGLNSFTESVAIAALDNREWVRAKVREMKVQREHLAKAIEPLGFGVYPSECNFLLCKSPVCSDTLVRAMRENGVAIRDCGAYPLLRDHVRLTIGPRPMMEKFLETLEPVLNEVSR